MIRPAAASRGLAVSAISVAVLACGCGAVPRAAAPVVPSGVVSPSAHPVMLIARTTWTVTRQGRELQVVPTSVGRTDTAAGASDRAWAQVLADAPDAGSPGMHDQFLCHWNYARLVEPDKPSWNLEPWRPAVGYDRTVAALCNPGGPEG